MADLKILSSRLNVECGLREGKIFKTPNGAFPFAFGFWLLISPEKKDLTGVDLLKDGVINSDFFNQNNFERVEYKNFFITPGNEKEPKDNEAFKGIRTRLFVKKDSGEWALNEEGKKTKMRLNIFEIDTEPFYRTYSRDVTDDKGKLIGKNGDYILDAKGEKRVFTSFTVLAGNNEEPLRLARNRWVQNRDVRVDNAELPPLWITVADFITLESARQNGGNLYTEGDNNGANGAPIMDDFD